MSGFVNHTFFHGLVEVLGIENALKFLKSLNLVAKDYQGRVFEGNACQTMLKNCDKIMEKEVFGNASPFVILPYVRCCKAMDRLVHHALAQRL